jgi:hypothetical protein
MALKAAGGVSTNLMLRLPGQDEKLLALASDGANGSHELSLVSRPSQAADTLEYRNWLMDCEIEMLQIARLDKCFISFAA